MPIRDILRACVAGIFCGVSSTALAVNISTDDVGEVAVAPHFSVQDGWISVLNITNTRDVPIAIRVNIRESMNGRLTSTFVVALSAFDVFSGVIKPARGNPEETVFVGIDQPGPNGSPTCTVPRRFGDGSEQPLFTAGYLSSQFLLQPVGLVGLDTEFVLNQVPALGPALVNVLSLGDNDDGGPQTTSRLREGYIEFIEMGFAFADDDPFSSGDSFVPVEDANGDLIFDPARSRINIGNAIENHDCDLVELAFSGAERDLDPGADGILGPDDEVRDVLASNGRIRRILETARQFGEPINALKFNLRMLNPSQGTEFGVPGTTWANFYNPAAPLSAAADEQLLIDALNDDIETELLIPVDIDLSPLLDIGTLTLGELLELGGTNVIEELLSGFGTGFGLQGLLDLLQLSELLTPSEPADPSVDCGAVAEGGATDACVRPADNAACGITRGDQRTNIYLDWRPDGGRPDVGILRGVRDLVATLAETLGDPSEGGTNLASILNDTLGLNISSSADLNALGSCRNLITVAEFAEGTLPPAQALEPSLNDAFPAVALVSDDSNNRTLELRPAFSTPAGFNLPEDKRGVDALSLTIMHSAATNEWEFAPGSAAEWVVSMPTKPFYTDGAADPLGVGLAKPGGFSAISPRSTSPITETPFGLGLLESTSRPETILSGRLTANVVNASVGDTGSFTLIGANVDLPEQEPYPPFREPFGPKQELGEDAFLLFPDISINPSGVRANARSCNASFGAMYDRAGQQYLLPPAPGPLNSFISLLPGVFGSTSAEPLGASLLFSGPIPQFQTDLCYASNTITFGSQPITSGVGDDSTDAMRETNIPLPAPASSQFDGNSRSGWLDITFGYSPIDGYNPIDVAEVVALNLGNPYLWVWKHSRWLL
nr:hypothetical protein [Oceanococcus sp. HetDA_MAG_MS8]